MLGALKAKLKWSAVTIVACAIAFGVGRYSKKPVEVVQVEERVVEKVVEKIVEIEKKKQQKVTKVTKKPDGTTTTTVIDTTTDTTSRGKEASREMGGETKTVTQKSGASGGAYRPNYSAGGAVVADWDDMKKLEPTYQLEVGYRVLGNAWLTASYNIQKHQYGLGVRIDF